MPITEAAALELLHGLIQRQDTDATAIPGIWASLIDTYNKNFAPPAEPVKRKRKRRVGNPNLIGWPAGVRRQEYKAWKESLPAGYDGPVNPQAYKAQVEAGIKVPTPPKEKEPARGAKPRAAAQAPKAAKAK